MCSYLNSSLNKKISDETSEIQSNVADARDICIIFHSAEVDAFINNFILFFSYVIVLPFFRAYLQEISIAVSIHIL